MVIVITSLKLRNLFSFFGLANYARKIVMQLRDEPHTEFRKTGIGLTHYTMTAWKSHEDMQTFARRGAHRDSMKASARIAKEIRTLVIERDALPDWEEAKALLQTEGKVLNF